MNKINLLLSTNPVGIVFQSDWLRKNGYSPELQKRYRKSNWLKSIGVGAMIRYGDKVGYEGALYALQQQSKLSIHPAGRTALAIHGKTHYLEMNAKRVVLFGGKNEKLPAWFIKYNWGIEIDYFQSTFLPVDAGYSEIEFKNFTIKISDTCRAMFECLYMVPDNQDLVECYEIMEGLNNLPPANVQMLLEKCESVKVKRLFLFLAEKAGHTWFNKLEPEKINLGHGKRSITPQGVFIAKYQITVPKELK